MRFDLHVHTKYSYDGSLEPCSIIKLAYSRGLSGIAITDHNTIVGALKTKKISKHLIIIVGSEIKTSRGEVIGLFLNDDVRGGDFHEVVDQVRSQDGLLIIPHPFDALRKSSMFPSSSDSKYINGVEVFNSRCIFQRYNETALKYAELHGLAITAGSDAHLASEIGLSGIIAEVMDEEELRKAILRRVVKVFGSRSSILNHGITKAVRLWRRLRGSVYC